MTRVLASALHRLARGVRILIFHGYLLRGTGSNVYNAELAEALTRLGHEVHLLCQEARPETLGFVDSVGAWENGELVVHPVRRPPHAGNCTVYRPDIGGLLPVYVYDDYEGFEVRTFDRLDDAELGRYLDANLRAVRDVAAAANIEAGFANHVLMGPVILARGLGETPYAVKVHGSALEYTLKPHYKRFAPYASEGLVPARAVLVGSRHTAESLWAAMPLEDLRERTFLSPPGVDTHTFAPREPDEALAGLEALERWLDAAQRTGFSPAAAREIDVLCDPRRDPPSGEELAQVRSHYDPVGVDVEAPDALSLLDPTRDPVICFVGKLIVSKGIDLLLAAWPLVLAREPRAKLVVVGFGTYREGVEVLLRALERADERLLMHVCRQGRALEGGPRDQLTYLRSFLEGLRGRHERYFAAAKKMRRSIVFTGRLDHGELGRLLPCTEAVVMPSMFPEAFGMVAAEAAASGALPISAAHSGLAEVAAILGEKLPLQVRALLTFERGMRAVEDLAQAINGWLELDPRMQATARAALARTAADRFGWEAVAQSVVSAARGRTAVLEPVPGAVPFAGAAEL
jgi:glycosyltransferase involved in cell wall biosynthesis